MSEPTYRLVSQVSQYLREIYSYTYEGFGLYQADAYAAGLVSTFELLVKFPKMGRSADEYQQGLRQYRHKSHLIFYRIDGDDVVIEYLSHVRADVRKHLYDD